MKKVAIIIVNYNDSINAIHLIKNVDKFKVIDKIIVVDNASTDDSYKRLKKYENEKIHILLGENKGYSAAINIGSKYAINLLKDCYLIASNTDIEIAKEEDIKTLLTLFDYKDVGAIMPTVIEHEASKRGWKILSPTKDLLINIPFINRFFRKSLLQYDEKYFSTDFSIIDVVYGCFFVIDSKVLESISFLDENVFLYFEENILARKLQRIGRRSMISNNAFVLHKHDATITNQVGAYQKYKIHKQSQFYYEKNYNNANALHMFFFYLFYYINLIPYKIKLLFKF